MQKEEAEVAKWVYAQLNLYVADIVNEQKMVAQTVYDILSNQIGLISKSPNAPMTSRAPTPTMNRLNGMMMGQGMRQGFNQLMNYGSQAYNTLRNLFAKTLSTPPPAPEYSEEYQKFLDNTNVVQIETATKEKRADNVVVVKTLGLHGLKKLGDAFLPMSNRGEEEDEITLPMKVPQFNK